MSIREAIRELELWGVGANFSLTSYQDSAAKELSIIKDWKELVNQVSATILWYSAAKREGRGERENVVRMGERKRVRERQRERATNVPLVQTKISFHTM